MKRFGLYSRAAATLLFAGALLTPVFSQASGTLPSSLVAQGDGNAPPSPGSSPVSSLIPLSDQSPEAAPESPSDADPEGAKGSDSPDQVYTPTLGDWIISTNLHKITGYATLGLLTATAIAGPLGLEVHPYLGYTTLGTAVTNSLLGVIAYGNLIEYVWPHLLFNGLGEIGLFLNAFVWEPGSPQHVATGIASAVSFAAGYLSIMLLMR